MCPERRPPCGRPRAPCAAPHCHARAHTSAADTPQPCSVLEQLKEMPAWTTNFHRLYRKQTTAVFISDMTYASWIGEPGAPVHIVFIVGQGRHSPEVAGHKICVLRELVSAPQHRRTVLVGG